MRCPLTHARNIADLVIEKACILRSTLTLESMQRDARGENEKKREEEENEAGKKVRARGRGG